MMGFLQVKVVTADAKGGHGLAETVKVNPENRTAALLYRFVDPVNKVRLGPSISTEAWKRTH